MKQLLGRAATTAGWLAFFFASSLSGLAESPKSQPLNVPRDVVSISEIRPSTPPRVNPSEEPTSKSANEFQKRKLKKEKLHTTQSSRKALHAKLRKLGWQATPAKAQAIAWVLTKPRKWRGQEWQCLKKLWNKESSWHWSSDNPSSHAYGIPQALPSKKMAEMGKDWVHNAYTQIRWGLKYIKDRYSTPCAAWQHSEAVNWY